MLGKTTIPSMFPKFSNKRRVMCTDFKRRNNNLRKVKAVMGIWDFVGEPDGAAWACAVRVSVPPVPAMVSGDSGFSLMWLAPLQCDIYGYGREI